MNAKLKELDLGIREQVDALVLDVMERETKTGKPYVVLKVTDGDTTAEVKKWDARLDDFLPVKNTAVVLNVKASLYGNETTYDTDSCVRSKRPPEDFIRKAPIDLDGTLDAIGSRLDAIADPDLKALMTAIFRDKKSQLRMWSAAKTVHHAIYGGLLYHSYRMMQAADALCQFYPAVDKDLVASGALLHDIGKLEELDTNTFGAADYTTKGSLLGHAYLGTDLVSFYARDIKDTGGSADETAAHDPQPPRHVWSHGTASDTGSRAFAPSGHDRQPDVPGRGSPGKYRTGNFFRQDLRPGCPGVP